LRESATDANARASATDASATDATDADRERDRRGGIGGGG
jgi:hypothetical protein